jgi:hypothetical protein
MRLRYQRNRDLRSWSLRSKTEDKKSDDDIVSTHSKQVLFGLFLLIGFAIATYAFTVWFTFNLDEPVKEKKSTDEVKRQLNATEKFELLQQLEQVNGVYVAAISGAIALGGTLIAQVWGRRVP